MKNRVPACLKVAFFLAVFLSALCRGDAFAQSVALRYNYTAGAVLNYLLTVDSPSSQGSQKLTLTLRQAINSVNSSATPPAITMTYSFISPSLFVDGASVPFSLSGQQLSSTITNRGAAVSTTAVGDFKNLMSAAGFSAFTSVSPDIMRALGVLEFPEANVSAGSTWSVNKNQTLSNGDSIDVTYNYTLEEFVAYGGYDCARISIAATCPMSLHQDYPTLLRSSQMNGTVTVAGSLYFAYTQGKIVQLDETVSTNSVAVMISYDGEAMVAPVYKQSTVTLALQ